MKRPWRNALKRGSQAEKKKHDLACSKQPNIYPIGFFFNGLETGSLPH